MKKVWICLLAVFMLVSAFSLAGAAADLTVVDGKAVVDVDAVSIAAGSLASLNVKVADLDASEPIEFAVNVVDENGQPIQFSLTTVMTTVSGDNLDTAKSLILVGGMPIANGWTASSDDGYPAFVTITGKLVAIDASKPVSLDLGITGTAQTALEVEAAKAEITAENLETIAADATFAVKVADVEVVTPTEQPTEQPTETPTEVPTEQPTEQPTEVPTEQPTETPASPAPVLGLLAGLAAAGLFLRRE